MGPGGEYSLLLFFAFDTIMVYSNTKEVGSLDAMVSVIIPVYNRQNVVEECVRSVLVQSHQNVEVLLVDDGSSDGTVGVCRELEKADERVKLFEMAHAGVSAARNKGIDEAKGEYIFFLDSDDVIYPLLLEELIRAMEQHGAAIARTRNIYVTEKNWHKVREKLKREPEPCQIAFQDHQQSLRAIFYGTMPMRTIGGVMLRRDLVGQTRFRPDLFIGEDFYFVYENLVKGADTVICEKNWYFLRLHTANTSWNYGYDAFWSRFYRRELVWKNEEAMGRTEYANLQKRDAFGVFVRCLAQNKPGSEDSKRMCQTMKHYKKVLLPAMSLKGKLGFFLAVYAPSVYLRVLKLYRKLQGKA